MIKTTFAGSNPWASLAAANYMPTSKEKPLAKSQRPPKDKAEARERSIQALRLAKPSPPPLRRGERNGKAKLTDKQAAEIVKCLKKYRKLRDEMRELTPRAIASKFGVTETTVRQIHEGRTWRHLSGFAKP